MNKEAIKAVLMEYTYPQLDGMTANEVADLIIDAAESSYEEPLTVAEALLTPTYE